VVVFESGVRMRILLAVLFFVMVGCSSQPRFIHVQGMPPFEMFDNKTGQTCITSPLVYDSLDKVREDFREEFGKSVRNSTNPLDKLAGEEQVSKAVNSLDSPDPGQHLSAPEFQEFYKRYNALKSTPNNPPVYHYDGKPYCKEL
jgi:hypothetical protein